MTIPNLSPADLGGIIGGLAGFLSALYAAFALKEARGENLRQRRMAQVNLGQQMASELAADEILSFAVNRLDWGDGKVQIPPAWRASPDQAFVDLDLNLLFRAVAPQLTVANDPVGMLYRYSFIRLYDHLSRIAALERTGLIKIEDLPMYGWIAWQLTEFPYSADGIVRRDLFLKAIGIWYPDNLALGLIAALVKYFPRPQ